MVVAGAMTQRAVHTKTTQLSIDHRLTRSLRPSVRVPGAD